jgi:hypothetical protein
LNKHLLMLVSAAAIALSAAPALADNCPGGSGNCDDITTSLTAPIDTQTAPNHNIFVDANGSVKVKTAGAAVKLNSQVPAAPVGNWVEIGTGGVVSNTATSSAIGIEVDTSSIAINSSQSSGGSPAAPTGILDLGTLDLTGSGTSKVGILVTGVNGYTGPITFGSNSITNIAGDNSTGFELANGSTMTGDVGLGGTMTITPTTKGSVLASGISLVDIRGTLDGSINASGTLDAVGEGAQGIVVTGSVCNAAGCASGSPDPVKIGTITNIGTIKTLGEVLAAGTSAPKNGPEGGSALFVAGTVEGGILNNGPPTSGSGAVLQSSGAVINGAANATVMITNSAAAATKIGVDTNDVESSTNQSGGGLGFSFINRGTILATPLSADVSSQAMEVTGAAGFTTTFTGYLFNAGIIDAMATSDSTALVNATALNVLSNASIPRIVISDESTAVIGANGAILAGISGAGGGSAVAIRLGATTVSVPEIDILPKAEIVAQAQTITPTTVTTLQAVGILDASGSLLTIENAGTIRANATVLTQPDGTIPVTNFAHAVDLSAGSTAVTFDSAGAVVGDVILNGSNSSGRTILNVGVDSGFTGADAQQTTDNNAGLSRIMSATGFAGNDSGHNASILGDIAFGTGSGTLNVNDYAFVNGVVTSAAGPIGALDVNVSAHGSLTLQNAKAGLLVNNLTIAPGASLIPTGAAAALPGLGISVSNILRSSGTPTITATGTVTIGSGALLQFPIVTYVPQAAGPFQLIKAPKGQLIIAPGDIAQYQTALTNNLPFFFQSGTIALDTASSISNDFLVLTLTPKTAQQLGLTGDAKTMFPVVDNELSLPAADHVAVDDALGAALVTGLTPQNAQNVYSQFAPDVSGDERAIAVSLTDSATGPVAARQRLLRMYGKQEGTFTLWGQEYAQFFTNKGNTVGGGLTNYKDHGFGFVIGADGGNPVDGWYGGSFTFFAGDGTETLPRDARNQSLWYMLTAYSAWRGHHLFLDTQLSVAGADLRGKRFLVIDPLHPAPPSNFASCNALSVNLTCREADNKRTGLVGAFGATTGAIFTWKNLFLMPEISLDAMTMREEGYTERNGGNGFDLKVDPYYANSLRAFVGADSRIDIDLGDFLLQPEARLGYRFEFLNDPVKLRAAFAEDPVDTTFKITGPDPGRGNFVAGASLGASTDTWSMGLNFDWVRGDNGSTSEVGTFSLLGRI